MEEIEDAALKETIRRLGVLHALDFDKQLDAQEEEIVRRKGVNRTDGCPVAQAPHRFGVGRVSRRRRVPRPALRAIGRDGSSRRNGSRKTGKHWYEYHRPRDPRWMLSKTRILSPTLVKEVRFSLDNHGYLSDHACLYLQPTVRTNRRVRRAARQARQGDRQTGLAGDRC